MSVWLALAALFPLGAAVAAGETIPGERLDPATNGPGVIESMEEVLARDQAAKAKGPANPKGRNGAQGTWVVPNRRSTYFPHSGEHNVVNKWGDTNMGMRFPAVVDVAGAYFAGQAGEGAWTAGIKVIGYRDGQVVQRTDWFRNIGREPQWFEMNLPGVDRIVITSTPVLQGGGWYGMDDLTFTVLPKPGEARPDPTVIDFEDVSFSTTLTGSGYAGLIWEMGTGDFTADEGIHHPIVPPEKEREESQGRDELEAAPSQGGATLPILLRSFQGTKLGDAGQFSFPPDTMGAAGPNHFVVTVNRVFAVYEKTTGTLVMETGLRSFLPGGSGDPRVLFDQHSGRWVVIVSDFLARIFLAVSLTDDPTGSWFKTSFEVGPAGTPDEGKWPDYPTLGVDVNGIYTAAFLVGGDFRMTLFAIDKAPLIDPTPSLGTVTAFRLLPWEGAIHPVHTYGDPGGEFLVSRSSSTTIRVRKVNPPLTSPTLSEQGFASIPSHSSPPDAPALGANTPLDTVGHRLMMAVYRQGSIWTTHAVNVSGRSACRWYEIDSTAVVLLQSGTVSDDSLYYFFPSIMVNAEGAVVMGFTGSDANNFPSTYYTGRLSTDPPGAMAVPALLHEGTASQNLIDNSGRNRFGDYSQTTLDPVDEMTIWTIQEYDSSPNIWSTWIGSFSASDCNNNGIIDECDVDCGVPGGACDVPGCGGSEDCNGNLVPDGCENDCNLNGIPDECDIVAKTSSDCNGNSIPDECDLAAGTSQDCQPNGVLDECDILSGTSVDCVGPPTDCFFVHPGPGCNSPLLEACVCAGDPFCCTVTWDNACVTLAETCSLCAPGIAGNGVPDECETPCDPPKCDDANACTADGCNGEGICIHILVFEPATQCCNPTTGGLTLLEDGDPCTVGTCNPDDGTVAQNTVPDGPTIGCGLGDPCNAGGCVSGTCVTTEGVYADVDHDGSVDLFDLFCVLNGFTSIFDICTFEDLDIEPCEGNGIIDIFDLFAVLNAFAGSDPCCGGSP